MIEPWIEQLSIAHLNSHTEVTYGDNRIPMPEQGFLLCALPGVIAFEYSNAEEQIAMKGIKDAFLHLQSGLFQDSDMSIIDRLVTYLEETTIPGLRAHFMQVFFS